jgi:nitronate monooxygenase
MKMKILENWWNQLTLPIIAAPMFLVSGIELVKTCCLSGIIGSFPAPNARSIETLDEWMESLSKGFEEIKSKEPHRKIAPWAMNMVVHRTYSRHQDELSLIKKYKPPLVITSLGSPKTVVEVVHEYGGLVFSDVIDVKFARKAAEAGADGLILVASGAGGHAGKVNGLAFIDMVRSFWDGIIVLAGGISSGSGILAAQAAGADFAYLGTRFIVAKESMAKDEYREMVLKSTYEDLILTDAFTGVNANMLKPSIVAAGLDPEKLVKKDRIEFEHMKTDSNIKAWKNIWSAGHGVGAIQKIETAEEIINGLVTEYQDACRDLNTKMINFKQ